MGKGRCSEKREITVALAGNPNVGKSTLFNSLTGMRVHTGNWAGKTVGCSAGFCETEKYRIRLVDIPGTYSLFSHSEEERIARDHICFGRSDITVVVCDSTALLQNLNLALQITEIGRRCVVALNFSDEARKKGIEVDSEGLSKMLGAPVVKVVAHKKKSLEALKALIISVYEAENFSSPRSPVYIDPIERAAEKISSVIRETGADKALARWLGLRLMDADAQFSSELLSDFSEDRKRRIEAAAAEAADILENHAISQDRLSDIIVEQLVNDASKIAQSVTVRTKRDERDIRIDRILTGKLTAYPFMLILLFLVFWLTLSLANFPSEMLSRFFVFLESALTELCNRIGVSTAFHGALVLGIFRTLGQVISVMLPPMVIFFPLFAILEDSGYLPRIAYNLDRPFACSGACGKQALTMCMGLGCNAVGIVGCRIIDSKRERSLAAVTNNLVPCNGRLPMMITLISVFCLFFMPTANRALVAFILVGFIIFGIVMTFFATR
ncbi:MAG: ferrous iron transporter B, partial [Oscillospiraceae bacterium]|nr:ferrous iron transporter B [Oscillospiraceae bacterium]